MINFQDIKTEITSKLNLQEFFTKYTKGVSSVNSESIMCKCPFHEDSTASLSANLKNGLWKCFGCNNSGSLFDLYMKVNKCDFFTAFKDLAEQVNIKLPKLDSKELSIIDKKVADDYHKDLLKLKTLLDDFITKRGITLETIMKFNIGYDIQNQRYTIPIYDRYDNLVNIRKYKMDAKSNKMLNYVRPLLDNGGNTQKDNKGHIILEKRWGTARLFNIKRLLTDEKILICEGETDCIIAEQYGIPAVTTTHGCDTFLKEWAKYFKDKIIYICYDLDLPGRDGALKVANILKTNAKKIYIVNLPEELGVGGDITDYFVKKNYTSERFFKECINTAQDYETLLNKSEEGIIDVTLAQTTHAKYYAKKIRTEVLVSGKSQPAYMIPSHVIAYCSGSRKKCMDCKMLENNCQMEYFIAPNKPEVLNLINVTEEKQRSVLLKAIGINDSCPECKLEMPENEFINIEEIKVVPKIDITLTNTDYIEKTLYYLGKGIQTNQHYTVEGYVFPEPRNQLATVILEKSEMSMDNIDAFELTDEIKERLKIFQLKEKQTIGEKLKEEYTDYERNKHHIWERHDMMFALDLFFHSPFYINYQGDMIKGWINAMIIGDTATGKTELVSKMREHYGVGERLGGQGLTMAGMLGAVSQMDSGRWAVRWGLLPLNDRRALIIEEVTDMPQEIMEQLTDVMSSGMVNITKANGNEKTHARTRLLFITNTKRGAKLESYGDGPSAIREIITKDEDIRRMDFILTVAKEEVSGDIINKPLEYFPEVQHIYISQSCRDRILWTWSRKPHQIIFEKDAELEVFAVSKRLTDKYSSKFPLIESGDTRNKIRRMSVSLAGILVSTDNSFENIIVQKKHVLYIEFWLNMIYDKPSMGYDLYSEDAKRKYTMTDEKQYSLTDSFKQLPEWETLLKVLWESQIFRKSDVQDRVGYANRDEIRIVFKWLSQNFLIRSIGSHGYRKEQNLTEILKALIRKEIDEESNTDAIPPEHIEHHKHKEVPIVKEIAPQESNRSVLF